MSIEAVKGREGKTDGGNWFSVPPRKADVKSGHSSMCNHALNYPVLVTASGDQDSFLHSEISKHIRGFISIHGGEICSPNKIPSVRTALTTLYCDGLQTLVLT